MNRKSVTLRDVAKLAGVGLSTVSYVLNGDETHVSAATRDQILAAARQLNYRPNAIARSMVKRKTATVGLIITELQNPLFVPVTVGVEESLRAEGYHILLASADNIENEIEAIELLRSQQVDGFIFMSLSMRFPTEHLQQLNTADVPFVVINRDLGEEKYHQVQFYDRGAGRDAAQHLINLGHHHIGTITGPCKDSAQMPRRRSAVNRHEGWLEALTSHGLRINENWIVDSDYSYEGGYQAIYRLLGKAGHDLPTALFVANDMMAMGSLRALSERGVRVPQDIAVVTIGDPPFAAYTAPPLTTLALPIVEAGRVAARMLLHWIHHGRPEQPQQVVLDYNLIVRQSCGAQLR